MDRFHALANQQRNTGSGVLLWYISPLSLTISIGSGSGSIQPYTGTKTHTYSTYVTVTATPAAGYNFIIGSFKLARGVGY